MVTELIAAKLVDMFSQHAEFRPRTTSPPSQTLTFQPSRTSAFRMAGLRTPTPFAECVPRPVMILRGLAEDENAGECEVV